MGNVVNTFRPGIFIMVKHPQAGKVKVRLAKSLGETAATGLYRAFILDTLATVQDLDVPFYIAVHPPESHVKLAQWLGPSLRYFPQKGANLGERLHNGFIAMFNQKYNQVIALASDCPDLPAEILQKAVSNLKTHKAVIGPATDGGYYLIGFSKDSFIPDSFRNISWSTDAVFQETLTRIEAETNEVCVLPEWQDIDTKSNLQEFYMLHKSRAGATLHSLRYLRMDQMLLEILFS